MGKQPVTTGVFERMSKAFTFQDVIMRLEQYWADHGCLIWQPYSEKVGAGTANPATVLRVLGPEPWNVAYVEPSYRPDDGRYAENPNRMQMHTQYQVILKPAPANAQELYLGSLEAIGIDRRRHDIRFVEDNWESPALGAWGLGWEVWLDGLEITQFTYFQQAGGYPLDPVPVEYTYGLERIVMYLQNVREVWQIDWDGRRTYGDLLRRPEIEHCTYDFQIADVGRLRQMYDLFEAEARNALAHRLVIPAHDYVLRCSHTFNLMDARGAIGVTERAGYFARMRDLARQVSVAYYEQRQDEGFPWLEPATRGGEPPAAQRDAQPAAAATVTDPPPDPSGRLRTGDAPPSTGDAPPDFLLEVGTEELPSTDVVDALAQLATAAPKFFDDLRLSHDGLVVTGTPRRLVVQAKALSPRQDDEVMAVKGPPADRAFDANGNATPAAEGFARKWGVPPEALEVRAEGGGRYVYAVVKREGRPAVEVLGKSLPGLISGLRFAKTMRWNETGVAFSRPIRWFLALLGEHVVPFSYAGVDAGRVTRGPRSVGSPALEVANAGQYGTLLAGHGIIVDRAERRALIADQVAALAAEVGATTPDDPGLLDEVTDLVEQPTPLRGTFSADYLHLPKDVLVTVMKKHQRYFPVVTPDGAKMLPYFIAVRNGGIDHLDEVRAGNEGVLRARYADADYFYKADASQKLETFTPRLATLTFQEKLGSMLDKVGRVKQLVPVVGRAMGLSEEELALLDRAANLYKSDLTTQMVVELTALQGIMGREYALLSGESPAVADAIFEHYLPRSQADALPKSCPGLALGVANRLDSLAGLFSVGLAPTSTTDPFGLRRDALGLVQSLIGREQPFDLRAALRAAVALLPPNGDVPPPSGDVPPPSGDVPPVAAGKTVIAEVLGFIRDRLYGLLRDQGLPHDVVAAVLAEQAHDPYRAATAARDLAALVEAPGWQDDLTAYARCKRIVRNLEQVYPLAPERYELPAERDLHAAWERASAQLEAAGEDSVPVLGQVLRELRDPINRYFTDVLVMAEDPAQRAARLALVQRIAALPDGLADLGQLQGF